RSQLAGARGVATHKLLYRKMLRRSVATSAEVATAFFRRICLLIRELWKQRCFATPPYFGEKRRRFECNSTRARRSSRLACKHMKPLAHSEPGQQTHGYHQRIVEQALVLVTVDLRVRDAAAVILAIGPAPGEVLGRGFVKHMDDLEPVLG